MITSPAAEILTIGDELCRGEIVDTNSAWMAERLTALGFHVRWRSSTTDEAADMEAALRLGAARARVVLVSGGLGPTEDDRTVDAIAAILGVAPSIDAGARGRMKRRFAERGFQVTPNNLRQVRVPEGADVIANGAGLAPGFRVRLGGADVFVTPGVPREMRSVWGVDSQGGIEARLREILRGGGHQAPAVAKRVWRVAAMGESHVDHRLRGLLDGPPPLADASLHFRIAYPENLVTVVVRRPTRPEADAAIARLDGEVRARLGEHVYGVDDETLPLVVGRMLRDVGATVATAESCTGGLLGDLITDVPGSSDYFRGGVVAYSNDLKVRLLGVRDETLREHGAVSEACAREMAEGIRRSTGATFGLATTGIAGPGGGTPEKPVGLVHFAVAGPVQAARGATAGAQADAQAGAQTGIQTGVQTGPQSNAPSTAPTGARTEVRRMVWPNERRMVKQMAAFATLFLLYRELAAAR